MAKERFQAGTASFTAQGAKVAQLNPDAVLVASGGQDAPTVVRAIANAGVTDAPIIGYSSISSTEVFQRINLPNYYAYRTSNIAAELPGLVAKQQGTPFAQDMKGTFWADGWGIGHVLTEALRKCGTDCSGPKLIETLETMGPVSIPDGALFGPITYSASNHAGLSAVQGYRLDGGAVVKDGGLIDLAR